MRVRDMIGQPREESPTSRGVKRVTANGHILDGTLFIHHENEFWNRVAALKDGECLIRIDLGTRRQIRFNNYHFGACQYVADKLDEVGCGGWTAEDVHYHTVGEINAVPRMFIGVGGEIITKQVAQNTRDMTTGEFMIFRDKFNQYWAEKGIAVKDEYWGEERTGQ